MTARDMGRSLTVRLSPTVVREVARRAARCGLDVPRYLGQAVEAYLAGERCRHGPPRPTMPATTAPEEMSD